MKLVSDCQHCGAKGVDVTEEYVADTESSRKEVLCEYCANTPPSSTFESRIVINHINKMMNILEARLTEKL